MRNGSTTTSSADDAPRAVAEEPHADDDATREPSGDDLGAQDADAEQDGRGSSEAEAEPTMDARDALSEAINGEHPASETTPNAATLLLPDEAAIIRLSPGVSPPPKDARFLDDLYRAVRYLHAKGLMEPASGEAGEAMWDRYADTLETRLTEDEVDELSEVASHWHPQVRGLLGAALQPPPKPRVSMSQGFLIGVIGFALGALVTHNAHKEREKREAAALQAQQAPALPQTPPPWNPAVHGSVEQYRATYGHLSGPLDAPGGIGLDRSAPAPPAYLPHATNADAQGAAQARKRREEGL